MRSCGENFLADPRHQIPAGIDQDLVVSFASGVQYIHPDKAPELWINQVSIAATHRGRGLGKAVLRELLQVARAYNCTTV